MRLLLTRDSVAAGDDCDAPHSRETRLAEGAVVEAAVAWIADSGYLPQIGGGKATWSLISNRPIAVLAQQWSAAKMLSPIPFDLEDLNHAAGTLRIHASYHAQQDPDLVFDVLSRLSDGF